MRKSYLLVPALALALSGCFFVSKKGSSSGASEPKNHGQARSAEVHDRNAERKADQDAEKANKKK